MDDIRDIRRRSVNRPAFAVVRQPQENNVGDWEDDELSEEDSKFDKNHTVDGTLVTIDEKHARVEIPVKATLKIVPQKSSCPLCHGAGYVRKDVLFGHRDFGKPIECSCHQVQRKEREQQQLRTVSQLDTLVRFEEAAFETYDVAVPGVKDAFQAALRFAIKPKGWLVLLGPNGCGKTHLAVAAAKERIEAGDTVLIKPVPDLLDYLRSGFSAPAEQSYDVLFEQMRRVDLLVLDDLGSEQGTSWAREKIFQLLNYRYNAMLPTLITGNLISLNAMDPRIVSRLSDRGLVTMIVMDKAHDYRPLNEPRVDNI